MFTLKWYDKVKVFAKYLRLRYIELNQTSILAKFTFTK